MTHKKRPSAEADSLFSLNRHPKQFIVIFCGITAAVGVIGNEVEVAIFRFFIGGASFFSS